MGSLKGAHPAGPTQSRSPVCSRSVVCAGPPAAMPKCPKCDKEVYFGERSPPTPAQPRPGVRAPRRPHEEARPRGDPARPLRRAARAGGPGGRVPRADAPALPATAWVCGSGPRRRMALSLLIPGLRPALYLSVPLGRPLSGSPFLQVSPSLGLPRSPAPRRRAPGGDRAAEGEALRSCRPSHR